MAPPPPAASLSPAAPAFRPTFTTHASSPPISSLLFLPNGIASFHRRHSDFPSSGFQQAAPSSLTFRTPQLGSAALWDDEDENLSPAPGSAGTRQDSLWGSPLSEESQCLETPPSSPGEWRKASFSMDMLEGIPVDSISALYPGAVNVQDMAAQIAALSRQLASSATQLDMLRAENLSLRALTSPASLPSMTRQGSVQSSQSIRDDRAVMEAAFNGIPPPVQILSGAKLARPPPEIAQDILLGTMDYREFFAMPGPHSSSPIIAIETYSLRIQWVVAVLAGEYPAKEGALRRAAGALTDILNGEKRFSRRVVVLLNTLATAASALAVRPQGNYLIQTAFGCGREVRQAFFEIMQPDFKTIITSQYGVHCTLKMIVRDDMRNWFVASLVELLADRRFLQTRGGTRVLEQAFKSFSREQRRPVYAKLAEIMNGHWLECALSINGCLVVQNLIELHPHHGDFDHQYLDEVLGGINQIANNSHGTFVLGKLLIHPGLRSQTLLALFASADPLCAGPDVGRDALLEGSRHGCSAEEWGDWAGKVCDGSLNKTPSLVTAIQRPGGVGLLVCILKETPTLLADRVRATLNYHSPLLRCTAPGREALNVLGGSSLSVSRPLVASYPLHPSTVNLSYQGLQGLGRGHGGGIDPQMRWGLTLGGGRR